MAEMSRNAREIFLDAIDLPTEGRAAYLDEACDGDAPLRRRVEALLRAHDESGPFLSEAGATTDGATSDHRPAAGVPGGVIAGRYKLLEQIGEGGMGTVWMAAQTEPVKRRVAVKLIKPGMDSRAVLARFEAERQALALMDHPNIAKVLDGGTTAEGRPYFVMELVKGLPLTDYCDARRLSVRDRLGLFGLVCSAVQHAHQKGVIHRDLKPTNVLVTEHDGKPVPMVIDFGLAKALAAAGALTDKTLHTAFGATLGTPLYMAPEQVGINALDVDTRTDIYALGVILYELLTGSTPLEKKRLHDAAWDEMRRLIREEEPPRPSTRLSSSVALPSLAANRQIETNRLTGLVRGELDWIVLKALEKDRNRRYESVNGLAMDIRRHLTGEPVTAVPPSAGYRLRKSARKHRAALTMAAAIALLLVAGVAVSTWQAVRATRAEAAARRAEQVALRARRGETERAEGERRAKQEALESAAEERRAKETVEAVLGFVESRIFAAARPKGRQGGLGYDAKLADAVTAALPFIESGFPDRPLTEARLRVTIGLSFLYLGKTEIAEGQFEAARSLFDRHLGPDHPDTLDSKTHLANSYQNLGRQAEALRLREETLARRKAKLGPDHPDTLISMNGLANSYEGLGRHAEALRLREETLALMKVILGPDDPATVGCMTNLANSYEALGRHAEALKLREEALARRKAKLGPDHPDTLGSMTSLAISYKCLGRHAEALKLLEETMALMKAKLGPDHPDTLGCMTHLANSYEVLGRQAEDLRLREEALARRKAKLGPDHPDTLGSVHSLALAYLAVAAKQAWSGQDEELAATCRKVLSHSKDTKDAILAERVAKICSLRPSDDETHEAALVLARRAVGLGKGHPYLAYFQMALGMAEYRSGHHADAEAALLAASKLEANNDTVSGTAGFYRAMSLFRQGKAAEAHKVATEAVAKVKPLPADEKNPLAGNADADDLILWLAYKEARELIRFEATPPPQDGDKK